MSTSAHFRRFRKHNYGLYRRFEYHNVYSHYNIFTSFSYFMVRSIKYSTMNFEGGFFISSLTIVCNSLAPFPHRKLIQERNKHAKIVREHQWFPYLDEYYKTIGDCSMIIQPRIAPWDESVKKRVERRIRQVLDISVGTIDEFSQHYYY